MPAKMASNQPFRLLDLPAELRTHIFSYLLPSGSFISCSREHSPHNDRIPRNCNPCNWTTPLQESSYSFRRQDYDDAFSPQILRVNRQLHAEGTAYLYHQKIFVLAIYAAGYDFLKASSQLNTLPILPYTSIKEFVIEVQPNILPLFGERIYQNLLWLCGLIRRSKIHFKCLRIDFTEQHSGKWVKVDGHECDHPLFREIPIWEYTDDSASNIPPEIVGSDAAQRNFEYTAWETGFYSSFARLISPLQMLSAVTDKAVINVPRSCEDNASYTLLKQWYEEGLQGDPPFDEDDPTVRECRWEFNHAQGQVVCC